MDRIRHFGFSSESNSLTLSAHTQRQQRIQIQPVQIHARRVTASRRDPVQQVERDALPVALDIIRFHRRAAIDEYRFMSPLKLREYFVACGLKILSVSGMLSPESSLRIRSLGQIPPVEAVSALALTS